MPPDSTNGGGRWRRWTATVRFRVTAAATIAMLILLTAVSVLVVTVQRQTLTGTLEEGLERNASNIAAAMSAGDVAGGVPAFGDDDAFAQVVDANGGVVAASPNVATRGPVLPPPAGQREWRTTDAIPVDDSRFRTLSVNTADGGAVHVGATLDDVDESVRLLTVSLAIAVPVVTALLAGLVWLLVGRTLRPVEAIRREVAAIGGSDLDHRLHVPPTGDEISRLATTMNDMLERVERASQRQARFAADASHELRSPLTRIRSELEVDLAHPATADPLATHRSVLDETIGMQQLVDDLLMLARGDTVQAPQRQLVDLAEIVDDHARRARQTGKQVEQQIAPAEVAGNARELDRAIGNVIANAARHARGNVSVRVTSDGREVIVTVDDDGPGIAPADRHRVFERFTRLDESRTVGAGGAGLGLAIAADVIARHGGTITIADAPRGGARFELRVPHQAVSESL